MDPFNPFEFDEMDRILAEEHAKHAPCRAAVALSRAEIDAAMRRVANETCVADDGNYVVTRHVTVAEIADTDGKRWLLPLSSPSVTTWDVTGIARWLEQMSDSVAAMSEQDG